MFDARVNTWNLRDSHMAETLDALLSHYGTDKKFVVWAHNSHLGDARFTEMARRGELNLGQLVRERFGKRATLIGFTTHNGTVTAASEWDAPAETKRVRPSLDGSIEQLMHSAARQGLPDFFLNLHHPRIGKRLEQPRLERAIGVIYLPQSERVSHYFHAEVAKQFDVLIHIDQTSALQPLERRSIHDMEEPPETYPYAV
jgi:erythromycin esterase-like protein